MPLPIILGIGGAVAAAVGAGSGAEGIIRSKKAVNTIKDAKKQHQKNIEMLEERNESTTDNMNALGKLELNILNSFERFSETMGRIQNRPQFEEYEIENVKIPMYDKKNLEKVSIGAKILLGGLGSAAAGVASSIAAAGATSSAIIAFGTASTGTAIATLNGAAATNAVLAALGGGAIAAGGGGIALGNLILGASTAGIGILVGGIIFSLTGRELSDKADEAYKQMKENEKKIKMICGYLRNLEQTAIRYYTILSKVNDKYQEHFSRMSNLINRLHKIEWSEFEEQEKENIKNTVLLVGVLYKMCQVNLVNQAKSGEEVNELNKPEIMGMIDVAKSTLNQI